MDSSEGLGSPARYRSTLVLGFAVIVAIAVAVAFMNARDDPQAILVSARTALKRGEFARAEQLAAGIPFRADSLGRDAAVLAADAAERQKKFQEALDYLERIPDSDPMAERVRLRSGDLLLGILHQPERAESQFRRVLKINSGNVDAHERLAFLYGLAASSWEAIPHRIQLLKYDRYDAVHLFLLCVGDTAVENAQQLTALEQAAPNDPRVLLGLSRAAVDRQEYAAAKSLLKRAIATTPTLIEPHVKLGQLIQENCSPAEFAQWNASLPVAADAHPGTWAVRGTWFMMHDQPDVAIRCFWESVRRDPNHERSNYQLSQLLRAQGDLNRAEPFLVRSKGLVDYFNAVKIGYTGNDDEFMLRSATIAESLGLNWEAGAWYRLLEKKGVLVAQAKSGLQRLAPKWSDMPLARSAPGFNPAEQIDLSDFPLPTYENATTPPDPDQSALVADVSGVGVSYEDDAPATGLHFQYFNGAPLGTTGHRMYEFTGGGCGVLDYDRDGFPDLCFSQGCDWPVAAGAQGLLDRLFRNRDGHFEDVTVFSQIREAGFSQGIAAGDFDNDGFPDLYIANIGLNRFFKNNGDGTFTDATQSTMTAGNDCWSTSCMLADLNGDGLLDLYVVNYLSGGDLFDRVCPDDAGMLRSCSPRHFPAAQDQMWMNLGDGSFQEVTQESGIAVPDGKGLGLVAADFDQSGKLNVFVANDAVPNFYFVPQEGSSVLQPRFEEAAMISGVAVDIDGRPQACMGVAIGDANADGQLDLFVTNFFNECNTFYRQVGRQLFEDATRKSGLYDVSLKMVGFGTQFLDGDLDGRLDLVLVNGDVDDLRSIGRDYAQRPQYLWNGPDGTFHEIRNPLLGSYFSQKRVGRSLARLDWNRDGREDCVVLHLDAPVALLTNRSDSGASVIIRLVGTTSSREPFGATVTGMIAGQPVMRQLTAGDGYMASNERLLVFGLGTNAQIDQINIRWPSGLRTQLPSLSAGTEVIVVEGSPQFVELHRTSPPQ